MILKLGVKHLGMELYKVYINHDPGMTLTYFTARSAWVSHALEWEKIGKCHVMAENLLEMSKWTEDLCVRKYFGPRGLSAPAPGLYTCI